MSNKPMKVPRLGHVNRKTGLISGWLLATGISLSSANAFACMCVPYPADAVKAVVMAQGVANVIFLGTVTEMNSGQWRNLSIRDATFTVSRSWKGLNGRNVTVVRSAKHEMSCGFEFRKTSRYLVFAHWQDGMLWTNMCELTREEFESQGLIKALDSLKQPVSLPLK